MIELISINNKHNVTNHQYEALNKFSESVLKQMSFRDVTSLFKTEVLLPALT